jgi:hypothetical protein
MPPTRCSGRWPQPGHNIALLGPSGEGVCAGRSGAPGPNQTKGTTPPERVRAGGSHVRPRDMSGSSTLSDGAEGATARTRNVPGQGLWMRASTRGAMARGRSTSRFCSRGPPGRRSCPAPTSRSRGEDATDAAEILRARAVVPMHFEG